MYCGYIFIFASGTNQYEVYLLFPNSDEDEKLEFEKGKGVKEVLLGSFSV